MRFLFLISVLAACLTNPQAFAATTFFGPVNPYTSVADTPEEFFSNVCDDCVTVLEDFEDGMLDHGIVLTSLDGQIIGPGFSSGLEGLTDSVDGDDGDIDGVGNEAYSYFSPGNSIVIGFPSPMQSAGFVWTDGDRNTMTTVDFYGPSGLLGSVGPFDLADSSFQGTTGEDTFFGAQDPNGITSIVVTNTGGSGIEIDHIQFEDCGECATAVVPEPSTFAIFAFGFLGLLGWRRSQ